MSDNSHHIAHMLLGDSDTNKALATAVESGARGTVKRIIDSSINRYLPELSGWTWLIDIIVDFVFDYFNW